MTYNYPKVSGLYKFDDKNKTFTAEVPDENIKTLRLNRWVFTEKIDGTNTKIIWDGYDLYFGGRKEKSELPTKLKDVLNELFSEELFEQNFGEKEVVLYGEGYGGDIQEGKKFYKEKEDFILFDVKIQGVFLTRDKVKDLANILGLDTVPVLQISSLEDARYVIKDIATNGRILYNQLCKGPIEGFVGVPEGDFLDRMGRRISVKVKTEYFKK